MQEKNPYGVLNLTKSATDEDIKAAYIELVKRFDPEKHTERFMVIQKAYKTLTDPARRAGIDAFTINPVKGEFSFADDERTEKTDEDLTQEVDFAKGHLDGNATDQTKAGYFRSLMRRSFARMNRKMWSEAISDWTMILRLDATHLRARNNLLFAYITLGYQYSLHGLNDEAVELWERALKMNPDNLKTLQNLAIAADSVGDAEKARRYWSEVLKRWKAMLEDNPDDDYLRNSIIEVHKKLGGQALSEADQAPETGQPQGASAASRAADEYREILKFNPNDFDAQFQIVQTLMDERQWSKAVEEMAKLHEKHPKNVEVLNLMGWAYINDGQHDRAFRTWQLSLSIDPKNTTTRDNIIRARLAVGQKLREQGIFMKAIVHFKELLKFLPKSPEVHYEIGTTYLAQGDKRSALNAFNKVLQLDPKNKNAKKAISELRLRD